MRVYTSQYGDNIGTIARHHHMNVQTLLDANPHISSLHSLIPGTKVKIPSNKNKRSSTRESNVPVCPPIPTLDYFDHWIPVSSLEKMAETEYDVLIVGTGAGGGAALWRLCEELKNTHLRIGVVEAGNLFLSTHVMNMATMTEERYRRFWPNPKFWRTIGASQFDHNDWGIPSGFLQQFLAVGGRTLLWGGVAPRFHPLDFVTWPVSIKEMNYYYATAEKVMNVTKRFTEGSSLTQIMLDQLQKKGFLDASDVPMATDLQTTKYGEIHSNVFFSSLQFLGKGFNQKPFDLAVNARCTEVLKEKGRAVGIKVMTQDQNPYFLRAKHIVLATSALETPRILLHSKVDGPAIGHYLTNHSRVFGTGIICRRNFPEVLGTLGILIPKSHERPYQIQMHGPRYYFWYHNQEKPLRDEWKIELLGSGEVETRFENYLTLNYARTDEFGVPFIDVQFSYSDKDYEVIQKMGASIKKAASAMNALLLSNEQQPPVCLHPPGVEFHEIGTCRMGDDPNTSAVNRYGQVHGVPGLYVADNSVIPTSGAANPMLTTVALAIRTADYVIEQLK